MEVNVKATIITDEQLQLWLGMLDQVPETMQVPDRVFCKVPTADYNDYIDPTIGDNTKKMCDVYKCQCEEVDGVYVLVGEDDGYGTPLSGSRNLATNPITREEFMAWVAKYGTQSFHVDFPRVPIE